MNPNYLNINFLLNRFDVIACKVALTEHDEKVFSTQIKLSNSTKWNKSLQRIEPPDHPDNVRLELIIATLRKIQNSFDMEGRTYSTTSIVTAFNTPQQVQTLWNICHEVMRLKSAEISKAPQTIKTYKKHLNKVSEWLKTDKLKQLLISDFDTHHLERFRAFCRKKHGNKNCTINKNAEIFSSAIQYALEHGIINRNPLYRYKKLQEDELDITCISDTETQAIKNLQDLEPMLDKARDMFLFMSNAGMHIGDYLNLDNIAKIETDEKGSIWLKYKRGKTGINVTVLLSEYPESIKILEKYDFVLADFPRMASQTYNRKLKLLGALIGTDKNFTSKVVGRRKFTDTSLNQKALAKDLVITMLGHTSDKNIKHYGERNKDGIKRLFEQAKATTQSEKTNNSS